MICDLAETYQLYDYRALSPALVATLVLGLKDNSRVKMHYAKSKLTITETLLSMIVDDLNFVCWTYSKDARKGRQFNQKSILKTLRGEYKDDNELQSFKTVEEFEEYMKQFIR